MVQAKLLTLAAPPAARHVPTGGRATTRPMALWPAGSEVLPGLAGGTLHERLQPYIATLLRASAQHGAPVLRPLLYHFPDDPATYAIHDQMLLGAWLMIAPGLAPRSVYLPEGRWYDWWTGAALDGPAYQLAPASPERVPLYARAGAIIPSGPALAAESAASAGLTLDIFPGDGALTLESSEPGGGVSSTSYRLRAESGRLQLAIGARAAGERTQLRVHGVCESAAYEHPSASYDPARQALVLALDASGLPRHFEFALAEGQR